MQVDYGLHYLLALWSLITGAFLGAVYDLFRVGRLRGRTGAVLLFFEDLAFSAICSLALALLFFNLSFGRMRLYSFALVFVGFLVWRFTLGRVTTALCLKLIDIVCGLVLYLKRSLRRRAAFVFAVASTKRYCKNNFSRAKRGFDLISGIRKEKRNEKKADKKKQPDNQSGVHADIHIPFCIGDKPSGKNEGAARGA